MSECLNNRSAQVCDMGNPWVCSETDTLLLGTSNAPALTTDLKRRSLTVERVHFASCDRQPAHYNIEGLAEPARVDSGL